MVGYAMMLCFLAYLITGAVKNLSNLWNIVWGTFYVSAIFAMMMMTLFSVRHIHKHSQSIEHLGIRTNSTVMKLYVIFWTGMNLTVFL